MRLPAVLAALLLLAACSDEPSEADMRKAVEAATRQKLSSRGAPPFDQFAKFRKQGCLKAKDKPGFWDCYYNATFPELPGQPRTTVNGKGRFQTTPKGTSFEDLGAMLDTRRQPP